MIHPIDYYQRYNHQISTLTDYVHGEQTATMSSVDGACYDHVVRRLRPSQRMRMAASLTRRGPLLMNGSQPTDLHAVAAAAAGLGQQLRVAPR